MTEAKKECSKHFVPVEIWTKIIPHLPAKSLLRFRSVCKAWRSLIEDPDFVFVHLKHCSSNRFKSHLILLERVRLKNKRRHFFTRYYRERWINRNSNNLQRTSKIKFPIKGAFPKDYGFQVSGTEWKVTGTVNGLLLLYRRSRCWDHPENDLILWNPSIRRHLLVPLPQTPIPNPDSELSDFEFYLGFDSSNGDYKVVIINPYASAEPEEFDQLLPPLVEVFSLNARSWHRLESETCDCRCILSYGSRDNHVNLGGSIYWIAQYYSAHNKYDFELVSFDVASELFSYTQLPDDIDSKLDQLCNIKPTIIHGKHLGIVVPEGEQTRSQFRQYSDTYCTVWILTESSSSGTSYNNSWTKLCKIDHNLMLLWKNCFFFREASEEMTERGMLYDPDTLDCMVIVWDASRSLPHYINTYVESLVLL